MKKLAQLAILLAVVFGAFKQAEAALLIEPVVGYNLGSKVDFKYADGTSDSYSWGAGSAFGGRLGFQNLGFQVGLDYLNSSIDMNHKDFKSNVDLSEWAGFVGFEFPIMLRVYAGYIFSATGETKNSSNEKFELNNGTGAKAGIGFTGLPFIDINFEYRRGTFTEYKLPTSKVEEDQNYSSYMISLSLPFTI